MISKGTIIGIAVCAAAAIGAGIPTGIILHEQLNPPVMDYGNLDDDSYVYDMEEGRARYESARNNGKDFSGFSPEDAFNISLDLVGKLDNYRLQGIGTAKAMGLVDQEIRSTIIKDGDDYFEESYSKSSFVQVAWRMYQDEDDVTTYVGKLGSSVEVASFDENAGESHTYEEYSDLMGRLISDRSIYVVSGASVIDGENTSFMKTDEGYSLEIELDPVLGVVNYVKQMKSISDLKDYPSFSKVHLSMKLDEDLYPITLTAEESYHATTSAGIGSGVNGSLTTYFDLDVDEKIPDLNVPVSYASHK